MMDYEDDCTRIVTPDLRGSANDDIIDKAEAWI
jgi:hypothetical protein